MRLTQFVRAGCLNLGDRRNISARALRSSWLSSDAVSTIRSLTRTFIDEGFRAVTVCVDSKVLDRSFAGRCFDAAFLDDLPGKVDPCGENGEFHTFVFDGSIFSRPIEFIGGTVVERDGFFFYNLLAETNHKTV